MEGNGNLPAVKLVHRIEEAISDARGCVTYSEMVGILEIIKVGLIEEAIDAACADDLEE
tara:strand:+ start:80 stop:256 length:177 start_codon:yes stop_codon:yes gene_type:complete